MAKKNDAPQTTEHVDERTAIQDEGNGFADPLPEGEGDLANMGPDFNVNDEFKPEPLIPTATYHANVTGVKYVPGTSSIDWTLCLVDNGGLMSDGETPVDGATIVFKNWLPKAGDENELTSTGRSTKRQSKINQLKRFSEDLEIDMSTPEKIRENLLNQTWLGMEVDAAISSRVYEGRTYNEVKKMIKRR